MVADDPILICIKLVAGSERSGCRIARTGILSPYLLVKRLQMNVPTTRYRSPNMDAGGANRRNQVSQVMQRFGIAQVNRGVMTVRSAQT
jgi:hypothetical protein